MANAYPIDLCGLEGEYYQTYADHFAIYLPDRAAWERMALDEKLRIEHRLRHCQEIVGEGKRLYGVDLSFNRFSKFPYYPLDAESLTVLAVRSQRDENGHRCLTEWPEGIYQHKGLRGLYLGSNDLGVIDDTISYLCYYLDISDNPNIVFDASDICYYWQIGAYILYYDKTQKILNCDAMLE